VNDLIMMALMAIVSLDLLITGLNAPLMAKVLNDLRLNGLVTRPTMVIVSYDQLTIGLKTKGLMAEISNWVNDLVSKMLGLKTKMLMVLSVLANST
jgi:hypothetical protein